MDNLTVKSSVKNSIIRFALLRGTIFAGLGVLLLIYGTFLSIETLQTWGFPLFCVAIGLIALGLLPYKKLRRLEVNPYTIETDDSHLHFLEKGVPLFSVPLDSISRFGYWESKNQYGIRIYLKETMKDKIIVHSSHFDMAKFMAKSRNGQYCDLFLPYFSQRAFKALIAQYHAS